MKLTKKVLQEMIAEAMMESDEPGVSPEDLAGWEEYNNEVREEMATNYSNAVLKFLKGWHKAADVDQQIRSAWKDSYEGRKGDYSGKSMGTDEFFQKYYVGKSFKLEFLAKFKWAKINRFTRKHRGVIDTINIAIADLAEKALPEVGQLAKWSYNAMHKEISRTYGRHDKVPHVRIRMAIMDLANSIIQQDGHEQRHMQHLHGQIKLALELKDSKFEYEGKPAVDWRGWTPKERK